MLKSRLGAYDGRGNYAVHSEEELGAAYRALTEFGKSGGLFVEAWVPFVRELAVIVVRGSDGSVAAYPPVHTVQKDNICHLVFAPAGPTPPADGTTPRTAASVKQGDSPMKVAMAAVAELSGAGVFGVELFELSGGACLLNEIAPRVHNSGHFSIEAAHCSQFEAHVRAVCGLPTGPTTLRVPAAAMVNILASGAQCTREAGEESTGSSVSSPFPGTLPPSVVAALSLPGASVHWYGKAGVSKPGRKVGHVTIVGGSEGEVRKGVLRLVVEGAAGSGSSSSSFLASSFATSPLVGIVMGSDSDLPCMAAAAEVLSSFGVAFEITLVSAHRTPARLEEYGRSARGRGLKVIIAGAGGAAHLPGMLASLTPLPVIGVPVPLRHLDGLDSLYSILQMPKGVPVATVAIGNAANAALLAVRMLGMGDPTLAGAMETYQSKLEQEVLGKAAKLEEVGWQAYLQK